MRWLRLALIVFALAAFLVSAAPAQASHGMMQSSECGTYTWKADLIKGRTDSLLMRSTHTAGCFTYVYENYAPAGIGEAQGNAWQSNYCVTEGQKDVGRHFEYYRHVTVRPEDVKVSCSRWTGGD